MFKNFYKTIHNKHSRIFNFIFFLRYLFIVFSISFALFLMIPNFFSYEKKIDELSSYLLSNYNFKIVNFQSIEYTAFPLPHFKINNAEINFGNSLTKLKTENLEIFPNFYSIYNFKKFKSNKLIFKNNDTEVNISNLKFFLKKILFQKNKFQIKNLKIKIIENSKSIITIDNLNYANYGYKKNFITGTIFKKKIKIEVNEDFNNLTFKFLNSGIDTNITFNENFYSGTIKSKILNSNFKFDFNYAKNVFEINNFFFRNKNLSFKNNSKITLDPFLDIQAIFNVENLNLEKLKKMNFEKFFRSRELIKKLNITNQIYFKPKKFRSNFFDELNLIIDLAYGRINFFKATQIDNGFFQCKGNINLLEDNPQLFFDCFIETKDKRKFLNEFGIRLKEKNKSLMLSVTGNLNLFNNKINFNKILMDETYEATQEDLKYFKNTFEKILFDEDFIKIFNFKKIKNFIIEIS